MTCIKFYFFEVISPFSANNIKEVSQDNVPKLSELHCASYVSSVTHFKSRFQKKEERRSSYFDQLLTINKIDVRLKHYRIMGKIAVVYHNSYQPWNDWWAWSVQYKPSILYEIVDRNPPRKKWKKYFCQDIMLFFHFNDLIHQAYFPDNQMVNEFICLVLLNIRIVCDQI